MNENDLLNVCQNYDEYLMIRCEDELNNKIMNLAVINGKWIFKFPFKYNGLGKWYDVQKYTIRNQ